MDERKYIDSADTRSALQGMMQQSFRNCEGLTGEQEQESASWLKDAALAGYPVAMMHPAQVDEGIELAKSLLAKDSACCFSF